MRGTIPLTDVQRDLAERYIPLARRLAAPCKRLSPHHRAEIDSAALWGLTQAARDFDSSRGILFSTYARYRITGELRDEARKAINGCARLALYLRETTPPIDKRDRRVSLPQWEQSDAIDHYCHKLPPRHARACRLVYGEGLTHAKTAVAMGLSRPAVSEICKQAHAMLREANLW